MSKPIGDEIGRGGQFKVYESPGDRVMKVPNSLAESVVVHTEWAGDEGQATASAKQGLGFRDANVPRILRMSARYPALSVLLGRPRAEVDGCFSQDRVSTLGEVMQRNKDQAAEWIEKFAECMHDCWRFGLYDYLLLFNCNYGVTGDGDVVFFDFGEVSDFTPFVADAIRNRQWEARFESYEFLSKLVPDKEYRRILGSRVTPVRFNELWGSELDDLDSELLGPRALRDHPEDVGGLSQRIVARACSEAGRGRVVVSDEAIAELSNRPWGPPSALEPVAIAALEISDGAMIRVEDLVS
ncbi:hypothetical protein HN588_01120 [Candidatus Bathyarchaeota archaeon]|nr:hypothetical protein [Candidatus Bathyarchaeota archaeon]